MFKRRRPTLLRGDRLSTQRGTRRLKDVQDVEQFTHWLAEAVSASAKAEGAETPLVVVETGTPDPLIVAVTCHAGQFKMSVTERRRKQDGRQENEG